MPHSYILEGLLKNLFQATQVIASHPLESLPDVADDIDEEIESLKKKNLFKL
jgi:hypothetical protein